MLSAGLASMVEKVPAEHKVQVLIAAAPEPVRNVPEPQLRH